MQTAAELRIPFTWAERRPVFLDRMLYIPGFYERHEEWKIVPWEDLFAVSQPIAVEFCSGNGQWICDRAEQNPHINWVAIEKRFDRSRKIWGRLHRMKLPNLFIICGEAFAAVKHYLPKRSVSAFYVNFPDPWPKLRHAKNRLITTSFLDSLLPLSLPQATATFVTDDEPYAKEMLEQLEASPAWKPLLPEPYFASNPTNYGSSYFYELWKEKGRTIYYIPYTL
jgi:tRNA (guanine-N7-)-methyltransferase